MQETYTTLSLPFTESKKPGDTDADPAVPVDQHANCNRDHRILSPRGNLSYLGATID